MSGKGFCQRLAKRVIDRFPTSVKAFWSRQGAPRVFNCDDGSERFDVLAAHVNDEGEVIRISVSLDLDALHVHPSARQ